MRNKYGVMIPEWCLDISVASYPNPSVYGPTGGNRRERLLVVWEDEQALKAGLKIKR